MLQSSNNLNRKNDIIKNSKNSRKDNSINNRKSDSNNQSDNTSSNKSVDAGMPHLLAPAGDFISLRAAIDAGCDEVYFGIKGLNMRAGAKNFEEKDLLKIVKICHERGVKAFLALNTIIYQDELKRSENLIKKAKSAGIDAIICWDFSIIELCKKHNMMVHVSTQASVSNYPALKTLKNNYPNVERVVLARECTLDHVESIVSEIRKDNLSVEIEVFIHGAMCVAESGRCFMSQELFGKSANRGECLQPCRRKYEVYLKDPEEGNGLLLGSDYVMSPKDLCAMPIVDKIIDSGAKALKIEGRNRNPEYVYTVVSAYRKAVDAYFNKEDMARLKKELMKELEKVYNRGFSNGFYLGKPMNEWTHEYGSSSTFTKSYVGKVLNYYPKASVAEILIESSSLNEDDEIMFQGVTTGLFKQHAKGLLLDDKIVKHAEKKMIITLKVDKLVRKNDQLYKIIKRK